MKIYGKSIGTFGTEIGVYCFTVDNDRHVCALKDEAKDKPILVMNLKALRQLSRLLRSAESIIMQLENPDPGYKG